MSDGFDTMDFFREMYVRRLEREAQLAMRSYQAWATLANAHRPGRSAAQEGDASFFLIDDFTGPRIIEDPQA